MATVQEKIDLMHAKKEKILLGGGQSRIDKQHEKGKMTARERIEMFFDEGTFVELDMFVKHRCTNFGQEKKELPGEGVVIGYGTVDKLRQRKFLSKKFLTNAVFTAIFSGKFFDNFFKNGIQSTFSTHSSA